MLIFFAIFTKKTINIVFLSGILHKSLKYLALWEGQGYGESTYFSEGSLFVMTLTLTATNFQQNILHEQLRFLVENRLLGSRALQKRPPSDKYVNSCPIPHP